MLNSGSETYKPTSIYRDMVATKTISPSSTQEKVKYVPNFSTVSTTWDVRHLDKFLQKSEWAQNSPSNNATQISRLMSELSPKGSPKASSFQSPKKSIRGPQNLHESFFIRNEPRDAYVPQREYLHKIYKDFATKGPKNDINTLVLMTGTDVDVLDKQYHPVLSPYGKTFDPSKLEPHKQSNEFMSPKQRREQIEEVKNNQNEYDKWSKKIKELTKMQRVYKNGFRSGILGLDNPISTGTALYKEENEKYLERVKASEFIENKRKQELNRKVGSNATIEFFNRNFNPEEVKPPHQIVEGNRKKHVELSHVEVWKDSKSRLFGDITEKSSEKRKNYLMEQDTRGRKWDIISGRVDNFARGV